MSVTWAKVAVSCGCSAGDAVPPAAAASFNAQRPSGRQIDTPQNAGAFQQSAGQAPARSGRRQPARAQAVAGLARPGGVHAARLHQQHRGGGRRQEPRRAAGRELPNQPRSAALAAGHQQQRGDAIAPAAHWQRAGRCCCCSVAAARLPHRRSSGAGHQQAACGGRGSSRSHAVTRHGCQAWRRATAAAVCSWHPCQGAAVHAACGQQHPACNSRFCRTSQDASQRRRQHPAAAPHIV